MTSRFFQAGSDTSDSDSDDYGLEHEEQANDISESGSEESSEEDDSDVDEKSGNDDSEEDDDSDLDESDSDSSSSESDSGRTGASKYLLRAGDDDNSDPDSGESDVDQDRVVVSTKDKRFSDAELLVTKIRSSVKTNDWHEVNKRFDVLIRQKEGLVKILDGNQPKLFIEILCQLDADANEAFENQKTSNKKFNTLINRGLNSVRQKIRKLIKEDAYAKDVERYLNDRVAFMKEEVFPESATPKRAKKLDIIDATSRDIDTTGFVSVDRHGKAIAYTSESILKNLKIINEGRGRKGTDRVETIKVLETLFEAAQEDYQRIRVLLALLAARFDTTTTTGNALEVGHWKSAQKELQRLLLILESNDHIVVVEQAEEWDSDDQLPSIPTEGFFKVPGSTTSFTERLDDELTRSLKAIDPHTPEYIERLCDEAALYSTILRAQLYQERLIFHYKIESERSALTRIIIRRLEHLYFVPTQLVDIRESTALAELPERLSSVVTPRSPQSPPSASQLVKTLCNQIFKEGDATQRARAALYHSYWLALRDQYHDARALVLRFKLHEEIQNYNIPTQVLFNRALVQIGMAAFRQGLIEEAHTTLQEVCGSNRQKEMLAQGTQTQRFVHISPEQEKAEKQRQYPFHMHINIELLEAIYLTSSMLLEIPNQAHMGSSPEARKRVISKQFRRHLDFNERSIFTGPPENTREHVVQAAKALATGNWSKSAELIKAIKVWDLLPQATEIKDMLTNEIQVEGLRTYLFTYAPFYDTISLNMLSGMFSLEQRKVVAIISKMISNEEIAAALDQVSNSVIFRKGVGLSRLQTLALTLSYKASSLIDSNEKVLEQRTQGTANAFERNAGGQGGQGGQGGGRGGQRQGQRGGRAGGGRNNQGQNQQSGSGSGGQGSYRPRHQGFTGGALGRALQT